jgi:hypothetical protein
MKTLREVTFCLLEQLADEQNAGGGAVALLGRREGGRDEKQAGAARINQKVVGS